MSASYNSSKQRLIVIDAKRPDQFDDKLDGSSEASGGCRR
jgi:hypothetical protein